MIKQRKEKKIRGKKDAGDKKKKKKRNKKTKIKYAICWALSYAKHCCQIIP